MKNLIRLTLIAILAGAAAVNAQQLREDTPWATKDLVIKAEKGNFKLIIKKDRIYLSDDALRDAEFAWPDGQTRYLNMFQKRKNKHKYIIRQIKRQKYTWLHIGDRYYKFKNPLIK